VICLRCGKVEEFFGEPLQRLRKQIESHFGFRSCWRAPRWADTAPTARRCGRAKWKRFAIAQRSRPNLRRRGGRERDAPEWIVLPSTARTLAARRWW